MIVSVQHALRLATRVLQSRQCTDDERELAYIVLRLLDERLRLREQLNRPDVSADAADRSIAGRTIT